MPDDLPQAFNRSVANVSTTATDESTDTGERRQPRSPDRFPESRSPRPRSQRRESPRLRPSDADLSGANLASADLRGVNLSRANLRDANLANARMSGSVLAGAVLDGANLTGTGLGNAQESRLGKASEPRRPPVMLPSGTKTLPETEETRHAMLLGDDSTLDLVMAARAGDSASANALLERCLPALKRWTRGRIPYWIRAGTTQGRHRAGAALRVLRHLDMLEPRHVGAMQRLSEQPSSTPSVTRLAARPVLPTQSQPQRMIVSPPHRSSRR